MPVRKKADLTYDKPIPSREELVNRVVASFGQPTHINSREMIWPLGVLYKPKRGE